jgi:diguanylate cyclase (GGDEF)-like protein/PAS domain S-box-containing protein
MDTLRRDVTVGVCWGAAVLVAALSVAHVQDQSRDALVSRFSERATTSAAFVSAYVGGIFERERVMATALSRGDGDQIDLATASRDAGFTASVLLDADGRVVDAAPADPELLGADLASEYAHLGTALTGERAVSGVVLSAVDQIPIVAFALPLDGGRQGVLSSGFSFGDSPLVEFLSLTPIAGSRGYVIDADGVPAVYAGDGATESVNGIDTGQLPESKAVVVDGRVVVAAPISGTPWRLVLTAPKDTVVAPAASGDSAAWWALAAAALVSLGGLVLLRFSSRSRRLSRAAQAESEQRFRLTVENAPIGMTLIDMDGRFFRPNARLCDMLGYRADDLTELTFQQITHPDDVDVDADLLQRLAEGETDHYEREKRCLRRDGSEIWVRLAVSCVRDADGLPLHFVGQVEDLTEMRRAQENLERRALYDSLTGLANRSLLIDRLAHALAEQRRDDGLVAVAFCDLDHFKRVNDSLGHHAGDRLLEEVAARLQEVVRGGDTVARLGGDEFVILVEKATDVAVAALVPRLLATIGAPLHVHGLDLSVGVSVGVALSRAGESDPQSLLSQADAHMYAA